MLKNVSDLVEFSEGAYYIIFNYDNHTFRVWLYDDEERYVLQEVDDDYECIDIAEFETLNEVIRAIKSFPVK